MALLIFVALLAGGLLVYFLNRNPAPTSARARSVNPALQRDGDGSYETEIVGESHYQDALRAIAGPEAPSGHQLEVRAQLIPEPSNPHDGNAVAVFINGQKVGYLARDLAAVWTALLIRRGHPSATMEVDALITGGWRRERADGSVSEGHYGVKLDLVDDDDLDDDD